MVFLKAWNVSQLFYLHCAVLVPDRLSRQLKKPTVQTSHDPETYQHKTFPVIRTRNLRLLFFGCGPPLTSVHGCEKDHDTAITSVTEQDYLSVSGRAGHTGPMQTIQQICWGGGNSQTATVNQQNFSELSAKFARCFTPHLSRPANFMDCRTVRNRKGTSRFLISDLFVRGSIQNSCPSCWAISGVVCGPDREHKCECFVTMVPWSCHVGQDFWILPRMSGPMLLNRQAEVKYLDWVIHWWIFAGVSFLLQEEFCPGHSIEM